MKFLAVFVSLAAVACAYPATTTWTLEELSNALQSPGTDPILIPYLENALNEIMTALHHGQQMEIITIAMPVVKEYTVTDLAAALQNPNTNPAHIPYLEAALDKIMDAFYAGIDMPSITVVFPPEGVNAAGEPDFTDVWPVQAPEEEPSFIDVWPVQAPEEEPSFIDVWPVQIPENEATIPASPVAPAAPVQSASPLVQIIVNVQQASDVSSVGGEIERPVPVQVDEPLPAWGNFI